MLSRVAFLTNAGKRALTDAIEAVEDRSRAEIVVVVRPVAGNYLGADLLVGNLAALGTLAFLLYSPWDFALVWFLIQPTLAAAAVVGVLRAVPALRRLFVSDARRQAATREAAAACFFQKGIRNTRERTGVLVFVALAEQKVEILADAGITSFVPRPEWREAAGLLEGVFHDGGDAAELAERIEQALGPRLERWCESRPDDINELPNEVGA